MSIAKQSLSNFIFASRWLQAPLYLGLIIGLLAYVYRFGLELIHLVKNINNFNDNQIMLSVLNLIDVVMIANLLIMVIVAGYQTFVANLNIRTHPDHPEWLDELNAGAMKIKLAIALVAISSIHLLSTFIDPDAQSQFSVTWQVVIHLTLVVSALAMAYTNRLMYLPASVHPPKQES